MSAVVAPLYTAPLGEPLSELSTMSTALVPPFHPEMVPSSVAKMNRAGLPFGRRKSELPLKTVPVGVAVAPGGAIFGRGMITEAVPLERTLTASAVYGDVTPDIS